MSAKKNALQTIGKLLLVFALTGSAGRADILTWVGGTNAWHNVDHWTNWSVPAATRVPSDGDTAIVNQPKARVTLSLSSARLAALIINNATVSCADWDTVLHTTNLTIQKDGVLTCEGPFTNTAAANRVNVICENLLVETDGAINVDGRGYAGGSGSKYAKGYGPGAGGPGSGLYLGGAEYFGASHGGGGEMDSLRQERRSRYPRSAFSQPIRTARLKRPFFPVAVDQAPIHFRQATWAAPAAAPCGSMLYLSQ